MHVSSKWLFFSLFRLQSAPKAFMQLKINPQEMLIQLTEVREGEKKRGILCKKSEILF